MIPMTTKDFVTVCGSSLTREDGVDEIVSYHPTCGHKILLAGLAVARIEIESDYVRAVFEEDTYEAIDCDYAEHSIDQKLSWNLMKVVV